MRTQSFRVNKRKGDSSLCSCLASFWMTGRPGFRSEWRSAHPLSLFFCMIRFKPRHKLPHPLCDPGFTLIPQFLQFWRIGPGSWYVSRLHAQHFLFGLFPQLLFQGFNKFHQLHRSAIADIEKPVSGYFRFFQTDGSEVIIFPGSTHGFQPKPVFSFCSNRFYQFSN